MGSLVRTMTNVGERVHRHSKASRLWTTTGRALLRALALAVGAYVGSLWLSGGGLFVAVLAGCVLMVFLPEYIEAQRTEVLHRLSLTDPLTGLGNRRALDLRLEEEISRCSRGGHSVTVLMIDVDKLKVINDEQGHKAGDRALQTVSYAIRRSTRVSDVVGRWGGDEFLVIASDTSEQDAKALADRILAATARDCLVHPGHRPVGLSIGIATASTTDVDMQEVLDAADRAMYEAKQQGGDRAVTFTDTGLANVVSLHPSRRRREV